MLRDEPASVADLTPPSPRVCFSPSPHIFLLGEPSALCTLATVLPQTSLLIPSQLQGRLGADGTLKLLQVGLRQTKRARSGDGEPNMAVAQHVRSVAIP